VNGGTILSDIIPVGFETTEPVAFFVRGQLKKEKHKNNKKKNKTSSDLGSVPDPKNVCEDSTGFNALTQPK